MKPNVYRVSLIDKYNQGISINEVVIAFNVSDIEEMYNELYIISSVILLNKNIVISDKVIHRELSE